MSQINLTQSLLAGTAPKRIRLLIAQGLAPIPPGEMLELLVCLLKDKDSEISAQAAQTIKRWEAKEIRARLSDQDCATSVLEFFASESTADDILQIIISNPSTPDALIQSLALTASPALLESILDNRVRILKFPGILENIRKNPAATPGVMRVVQEIEAEFLAGKKRDYEIGTTAETEAFPQPAMEMEFEIPPEDLTLEGLPVDAAERESEIVKRLASLPVGEKIRYALFGNREIRSMLVRDTNKEVAKTVLHSPKLTENEVEAFSSMRAVGEEILREIGNSKSWTKSYAVVHNLVKNPKTPPVISQRLIFRLRNQDLTMLTRDRSVSDAVRYSAGRAIRQRKSSNSPNK